MKKLIFMVMLSTICLAEGCVKEKWQDDASLYCIEGYLFIKPYGTKTTFTQIFEYWNGKTIPRECDCKQQDKILSEGE